MQIIIVGGGKTGSHLAARLTDDGAAVTVIENRPEAAQRVRTACPAATVIEGSGADPRVLERAGVHIGGRRRRRHGRRRGQSRGLASRQDGIFCPRASSPVSTAPPTPGCSPRQTAWMWA